MENLFDDISRPIKFDRTRRYSTFEILNGADYHEVASGRLLLQRLYNQYPAAHKMDIYRRIRSNDDRALEAAFFELLLYVSLQRMGCSLEIHPKLANDQEKSPDFKVTTSEGKEFYLEATTSDDRDDDPKGSEALLDDVLKEIDSISSNDFNLMVSVRGWLNQAPSTRKLKNELELWLGALQYDELRPLFEDFGLYRMPSLKREVSDCAFVFTAVPLLQEYRGKSKSLLATEISGGGWRDASRPLRSSLNHKRTRYGVLDLPLVVAINHISKLVRNDEVFDALLGTSREYIQGGAPRVERDRDGVLNQGAESNRILSGVWFFRALNLLDLGRSEHCMYFNPWHRDGEIDVLKLLPSYYADDNVETMVKTDGMSINDLLADVL